MTPHAILVLGHHRNKVSVSPCLIVELPTCICQHHSDQRSLWGRGTQYQASFLATEPLLTFRIDTNDANLD